MNKTLLLATAASVCISAPALAQHKSYQIDLPAQPLSKSLFQLSELTGLQLVFTEPQITQTIARPLSGTFSAEEVLDQLTRPSGYGFTISGNVVRVYRVDRPAALKIAAVQAPRSTTQGQSAATESGNISDGLQEIIVTAQKREESLQDTPISISVLDNKSLEKRGITNLGDFASGAVPSLRIMPYSGSRASTMVVTMRGINPGDSAQVSQDPTVGIYVDGVYLGRTQGLGTEMFDVERIEVLRGPQGTLFGRNAVGGAISIVSKRPTGRLGLDLTAGVSNYEGRRVKAHLNLPEFAGISIKIDGIWNKRDGWVDNPLPGQTDYYDVNRRGARISALWQPSDTIDVLYSYDISRDASGVGYTHLDSLLPGAPPLPPLFSVEPNRASTAQVGLELEPSVGKVQGHGLHASWDISDDLTVRSITAYRKLDQTQWDTGGMVLPLQPSGFLGRASYAEIKQDQFSQELQLIGSFDRLNFVLGGFYFDEEATDLAFAQFTAQFNATGTDIVRFPFTPSGPRFPDRASEVDVKSKALFGQATFTPPVLDDRLHLTAGLRWTHDRKHGALTRQRGAVINIPFEFESKRIDPAFTAAFDWTRDINSYVRWSRAYLAGGANSRSATFRPFGEQVVSTWEVGTKADLFNRRARVNIAAYSSRLSDRQVGFVNPANPSNTETLNAPGTTSVKGVELDLSLLPARGLTLTGSYAFTDWQAPTDVNPFTGAIQRGGVIYTPRHAATGAIDYEFAPFNVGTLSAHLDVIYSSSFLTEPSSPRTGAYTMFNGRLTLGEIKTGDSGRELSFSLWGKNLTNTQWKVFQFPLAGPGLSNLMIAHWNEPRTYGLEARLTF
jgi:iron complex outermembrane recepter protein